MVTTDVRAPGEPIVVNLTCQNGNTLFLKWLRPTLFFRTVDVYNVHYRPEGQDIWEQQVVETVNNTVNHMVRNLMPLLRGFLLETTRLIRSGMSSPDTCKLSVVFAANGFTPLSSTLRVDN